MGVSTSRASGVVPRTRTPSRGRRRRRLARKRPDGQEHRDNGAMGWISGSRHGHIAMVICHFILVYQYRQHVVV